LRISMRHINRQIPLANIGTQSNAYLLTIL
jgi:hypothetical protein